MSAFSQLLGAVLAVTGLAAGLAVHGNLSIALRRKPAPRKPQGERP